MTDIVTIRSLADARGIPALARWAVLELENKCNEQAVEIERLRNVLKPFAEVAAWAERNGHDLLNDFDMLLRNIKTGHFAGHLHAQSGDFIAAKAALGAHHD